MVLTFRPLALTSRSTRKQRLYRCFWGIRSRQLLGKPVQGAPAAVLLFRGESAKAECFARMCKIAKRQAAQFFRAAQHRPPALSRFLPGFDFRFSGWPVSGYGWGGVAAPKLVTRTQHNQNMFSLSFWTFCVSLAACTKSRSAKRFSGIWTKHG